jgi:antitoxin (DNA-binding transcriptional repressor) of toxin-antitoxin stability system
MAQSAKMPSITLSQLRDTKRLLAWLRAGKTVELRERNRVIAHIVPVKQEKGFATEDQAIPRELMTDKQAGKSAGDENLISDALTLPLPSPHPVPP